MLYMVTFTINIPQMLAYIAYMDPMGYDILRVHRFPVGPVPTAGGQRRERHRNRGALRQGSLFSSHKGTRGPFAGKEAPEVTLETYQTR